MNNPILREIGGIFIPVRDIEQARDWYSDLLGLEINSDIQFGHIYVIPLNGTGIVLDSKIYSEKNRLKTPLFHFNTEDIEEAYKYMKSKNVNIITGIQYGHYFNFTDPDGNHLMICKC